MSRVFVTGLGFITSIGNDQQSVVQSLRELKSGIECFDELDVPDSPVKVAGTIKGFDTSSQDQEDWTYPEGYKVRREAIRGFSPHVLYAYCAMEQAIADAGLNEEDVSNVDTGIYTASAGSMAFIDNNFKRIRKRGVMRCNPLGIVASVVGTLSFNLVSNYQIRGSSCGFASACASSGHALGFASDEVRMGRQKRMFVVGAEDCNFQSIVPFAGMRALSLDPNPETAARPFDKTRQGFVSSGGSVVMVLESEEEMLRRGATPYCELLGWGQSSDGHNVAISHPEGRGLCQAMKLALKSTGLKPSDIDYLNAHAPSTPIGDLSEIKAIQSVFGVAPEGPMISSTKALTGHGLSLSSIMEAAFCSVFMRHQFLAGSANIQELDPEAAKLRIIQETRDEAVNRILSNSSGFGGANVSVVFKRCEA